MVAVVADSAANLPPELARDLGIEIVPMYLNVGELVHRDGVDLTPADLYRRMAADPAVATTSAPNPADFLRAYEAAGASEIVCVTVAASMSSSHRHAAAAAEDFAGRVEVVDSRSAAMAEGFAAVEAARAARAGGSLEAVAERARWVAARTRLYATVGSFEFLRRSGRVSALQAWTATLLDVKPVFGFVGGEISAVARSRTRRRALDRVVEETVREAAGRPMHLAVFHAAAADEARSLLDRLRAAADIVEAFITEATPVIGAHTGPGLVGTASFVD